MTKEDILSQAQDIMDETICSYPPVNNCEGVEKKIVELYKDCIEDKVIILEDLIFAIEDYNVEKFYEAAHILAPIEFDLTDCCPSVRVNGYRVELAPGYEEHGQEYEDLINDYVHMIGEGMATQTGDLDSYILMICDKYKLSVLVDDMYLTGTRDEVLVGDAQVVLVPEMLQNGVTGDASNAILHYSYQRGVTIG